MTKQETKQEIAAIIATADDAARDCQSTGEALSRLVNRLRFWGASPYEPRGLSDAGLSDAVLRELCWFRLPDSLSGELCAYLDG